MLKNHPFVKPFKNLWKWFQQRFPGTETPSSQEMSQAISRNNLFRLILWVRWELIFFFSFFTLVAVFFRLFTYGEISRWQPFLIILLIFTGLNLTLHRFHQRLSDFFGIYHLIFGLDTILVSTIISHDSTDSPFWGLYVPIILMQSFVLKVRHRIWLMTGWIGLCFGFVSISHYRRLVNLTGLALFSVPTEILADMLLHWLWVMSILAALTLIGTQLMTFLHQNMERLKSEVIFDPLTGLYNRRYFFHMLNSEIERSKRFGHSFSLMLIDLDNFKQFNDTYGHVEGDKLLQTVARVFRSNIRRSTGTPAYDIDIPCRYGGEEFVIILPEISSTSSRFTAERIRDVIHQELAVLFAEKIRTQLARNNLGLINVTASIGLASYPKHGETAADLIHMADTAMYEAKKRGKNRVITADVLIDEVLRKNPSNDEFDS